MRVRRRLCRVVIVAALFAGAGPGPAFSLSAPRVKPPRPPVVGQRVEIPAARAATLAALQNAKRDGDAAAVARIERTLGWRTLPAPATGDVSTRVVIRPERSHGTEKWGGDVRINQPFWPSSYPALACRSDGTFYAVVDDLSGNYLDLYRSYDGGETWSYWTSLYNALGDLMLPTVAIGEGVHDRLLIAYDALREGATTQVVVFWIDLDDASSGTALVAEVPPGTISAPKICVDSPEYTVWYAYLSFAMGPPSGESYEVLVSRTLDYGESWVAPTLLGVSLGDLYAHAIDFGAAGLFSACAPLAGSAGIQVRRSTNLGGTWGPPTDLGHPAFVEMDPSVAVSNRGSTAVVSYIMDYGGGNTDIEAFVTTDAGQTWALSYLPYTPELEFLANLTVDPLTGAIHAVYTRSYGVVTTQASYTDPGTWSLARRVNEERGISLFVPLAAAFDPSGARGLGVAWADVRVRDNPAVYFDASASTSPRAIDYLVICPQALLEPAAHLARYRELTGFGVEVVTLEEIDPEPHEPLVIDAFIEDFAVIEPRLRYVTLIGTVELLPGFPIEDGADGWYSDLRYADVDGDYPENYLPDISVGRIPVREPDQLWAYVDKVKDFELTRRFRTRVVFFGDLPEMTYVANRDSATVASAGYDVVTLYSPDQGTLSAALNDPSVAMALYYGHGTYATNWPLHLANLDIWRNDGRPVLYFSGGCNFNDNTLVDPPLGHALLTRPNTAATSIGATVNGGYGYAYGYVDAMLSHLWAFRTVGELHRYALAWHVADAIANGQDVSQGSWVHFFTERMMCHGDPALRIDGDVTPVPDAPPLREALVRPSPNPFNPRTSIRFELPARTAVRLVVYDVKGRVVRVLLDGDVRNAGPHAVPWDGRDAQGRDAPSGTYIVRLQAGPTSATSKLALVR